MNLSKSKEIKVFGVFRLKDSEYFCSDFRYESNGIFVLGVGFFFFRQISTF